MTSSYINICAQLLFSARRSAPSLARRRGHPPLVRSYAKEDPTTIPANALHLEAHRHAPNDALTKHNAVILVDTTHNPGESPPSDGSRCTRTLRPQAMP